MKMETMVTTMNRISKQLESWMMAQACVWNVVQLYGSHDAGKQQVAQVLQLEALEPGNWFECICRGLCYASRGQTKGYSVH